MSRASSMEVKCGCGHDFEAQIYQSANVTIDPDLLKRILKGEMNVVRCPACGAWFHVELPFLYHDMAKGEMIWVYPAALASDRASVDEDMRKKWVSLKRSMPTEARRTLEERYGAFKVVFGMDALVEHIMAAVTSEEDPSRN